MFYNFRIINVITIYWYLTYYFNHLTGLMQKKNHVVLKLKLFSKNIILSLNHIISNLMMMLIIILHF